MGHERQVHHVVETISIVLVFLVGEIVAQTPAFEVHPGFSWSDANERNLEHSRELLTQRSPLVVQCGRGASLSPETNFLGIEEDYFIKRQMMEACDRCEMPCHLSQNGVKRSICNVCVQT